MTLGRRILLLAATLALPSLSWAARVEVFSPQGEINFKERHYLWQSNRSVSCPEKWH